MAIQSFKDSHLAAITAGSMPGKGFPANLVRAVQRKLAMLEAATTLEDLRSPPSNHLHTLTGNRAGQHAIRVNEQFRICFVWTGAGPSDVEFTDYH